MADYSNYSQALRGWSLIPDSSSGAQGVTIYKLKNCLDADSIIAGVMYIPSGYTYLIGRSGYNSPIGLGTLSPGATETYEYVCLVNAYTGLAIAEWYKTDFDDMPNVFVNNTANDGANYASWTAFLEVLVSYNT